MTEYIVGSKEIEYYRLQVTDYRRLQVVTLCKKKLNWKKKLSVGRVPDFEVNF